MNRINRILGLVFIGVLFLCALSSCAGLNWMWIAERTIVYKGVSYYGQTYRFPYHAAAGFSGNRIGFVLHKGTSMYWMEQYSEDILVERCGLSLDLWITSEYISTFSAMEDYTIKNVVKHTDFNDTTGKIVASNVISLNGKKYFDLVDADDFLPYETEWSFDETTNCTMKGALYLNINEIKDIAMEVNVGKSDLDGRFYLEYLCFSPDNNEWYCPGCYAVKDEYQMAIGRYFKD